MSQDKNKNALANKIVEKKTYQRFDQKVEKKIPALFWKPKTFKQEKK